MGHPPPVGLRSPRHLMSGKEAMFLRELRRQVLDPVHRITAAGTGRRGQGGRFRRGRILVPFADPVAADSEVESFVRSVEDAGTRLVALNFYAGRQGDARDLSIPGRAQEFPNNPVATEIGARLGAIGFNASTSPGSPMATGTGHNTVECRANASLARASSTRSCRVLSASARRSGNRAASSPRSGRSR